MEMIEAIEARLVEPSSDAPKYVVLRDAIVGAISSGDWIPGMRLPTEAELAQTLPYSLGTVQKAYGELVRNGLVVRSRGRGSFVASTQRQMADPWHCRFLADDGTILPIYPRLIGHERVPPDARWAELFGRGTRVVRIDRVISINREFDIVSRFYTSNAIAKPLVRLPRDKVETANFKAILLQELGMPIVRVTQTVESANAPASRELQMKERPRLVIKATAHTIGGDTVYFQEFYIPANQRRLLFDSELKY
jgi:GntR family transcriptional regulator